MTSEARRDDDDVRSTDVAITDNIPVTTVCENSLCIEFIDMFTLIL